MAQAMRDSLTYYNTLSTKRYGVHKKINFAIALTEFVKDGENNSLLKNLKEKGLNLSMPLIYINYICDNIFNPDTRIRIRIGKEVKKIGLLEFHNELLEIENLSDAIVLKYRNELDAFITTMKAEVLE